MAHLATPIEIVKIYAPHADVFIIFYVDCCKSWRISYFYDAAGTKLAKVSTAGVNTYYAGSFVYNESSLKYIIHREGMYLPGGNYQYYLKDHLGNTRLVVNTSGEGGEVVQQTDYYPFGMDIATYNGGLDNKYRYNGKEFQDDLINGKRL